MGSFIFYCPHCHGKLRVDESWANQPGQCPACRQEIVFPPLPPPAPPLFPGASKPLSPSSETPSETASETAETPPETASGMEEDSINSLADSEFRPEETPCTNVLARLFGRPCWRNYPIGRFSLVWLPWLIALAVLGIAGRKTAQMYRSYHRECADAVRQHRLAERRTDALHCQQELLREFLYCAGLLNSPGGGFPVASGDCALPEAFPPSLQDRADLEKAQTVLRQYRQKSERLHQAVLLRFQKLLDTLQQQAGELADVGQGSGSVRSIVLNSGGDSLAFYMVQEPVRELAAEFRGILQAAAAGTTPGLSPKVRQECGKAVQGVTMILQRLLPQQKSSVVEAEVAEADAAAGRDSRKNGNVQAALLYRQSLAAVGVFLKGWRLDHCLNRAEAALKEVFQTMDQVETVQAAARENLREKLLDLWLIALLFILLLPGAADFFRAHFDLAVRMRRE